jgi:hypothetical protein
MNLTKAQRLLHKIQAFLDNDHGQELSRLERDLIKSYIQQLYDAVTDTEETSSGDVKRTTPEQKKNEEREFSFEKPLFSQEKEKKEPVKFEPPKVEQIKPVYQEYVPPVRDEPTYQEYVPPVKETRAEQEIPEQKWNQPVTETKEPSYYNPATETKKESAPPVTSQSSSEHNEALQKLFDVQKSEDPTQRFGHVPIPSIESAMGLNERIFTLNELFGGDKSLFDATCSRLNTFGSFDEARKHLMEGPASNYKWAEPVRIKMAEQFLRIVSRRYPKSGS